MKKQVDRRIAICINSLDMGGAERVAVTLVEYIANYLPVLVICLEQPVAYRINKRIPVHHLSKMTGNESNLVKLLMLPVLAFRLKRVCQRYQVRVVQSHLSRGNYINLISKVMGASHHAHIVIHGIASEYLKKGLKGIVNLVFIRNLFYKAQIVVVNSQGVKSDLGQYLHIQNRIRVIANPFDIQDIRQKCQETFNEQDFHVSPAIDYVISIGRLVASKRHIDLLLAFQDILRSGCSCEFLLLGDGEEKETLSAYIKQYHLNGKVHLLGRVQNPYKYLYKSRIFVSASETESFGNVLIEAMACDCPVVAADCPYGPREILAPDSDPEYRLTNKIEEARFGILVPVRDPRRMSEAIMRLLENEALRKHYIEHASLRCAEFNINKIGKLYKAILERDIF
jgi:N-acetylgalactosamine-N,N'-diacetylbacillosaminyl-diphospho-undecaprenol 4-alpha-N-acetylgalactosaminyltransferase